MANGVSTSKASPTNKHSENRAHKRGFSVLWGLVTFSHAVRRVFILHTQTHVCVFTRALWRVFIRFLPTSHTPQGVFSFFMRKRTFVFSLAPSGAFSFFFLPTFSHAARRVFILHAQTHVCVFTRALRRVFIRLLSTRRSRVLYSEPAPAGDSQ